MPRAATRCCSGIPTCETMQALPLASDAKAILSLVNLQSPQLMTFYDLLDDEDDEDDDGQDDEDADDGTDNDVGDDDGDDEDADDDDARIGAHGMSLDASDVRPQRCAAPIAYAFLVADEASRSRSLFVFTPRLTSCTALARVLATLLLTIPA